MEIPKIVVIENLNFLHSSNMNVTIGLQSKGLDSLSLCLTPSLSLSPFLPFQKKLLPVKFLLVLISDFKITDIQRE